MSDKSSPEERFDKLLKRLRKIYEEGDVKKKVKILRDMSKIGEKLGLKKARKD